jgi:hypothetical protein
MKNTTVLIISILALLSLFVFTVYGLGTKPVNTEAFVGFNITKATMDSPALIIDVENEGALVAKAVSLNATTIYDTDKGYAVIDNCSDIGYLLRINQTLYGVDESVGLFFVAMCAVVIVVTSTYFLSRAEYQL